MRYSKGHKAETHARIVRNAAVQLREKGARGVGVADLMKDVGLTHGGFYAHFSSRDDLVNEAIAAAMDQNVAQWAETIGNKSEEERFATFVDGYLSTKHRDKLGEGCAFAALANDVSRESAKTRRIFLNKLDGLVSMLAAGDGRRPTAQARQRAISTFATMMGTLLLARVAGNGALSQEILEAGKSTVPRRNGKAAPRKPASRSKRPAH